MLMDFDDESSPKVSQIFALNWVQREAAKLIPDQFKLNDDELKAFILQDNKSSQDLKYAFNGSESQEQCMKQEKYSKKGFSLEHSDRPEKLNEVQDDDDDDLKEFDLDNYDNEPDEIAIHDISNMVVFASNKDDPYLSKSKEVEDQSDSSEDEEVKLLDTDNLLVCACCEKDYAQLEIYVYNDTTGDFYIHHDIPLPSAPLCLEWLDFNVYGGETDSKNRGNCIAVGNLDSAITVWDIDLLNTVDPAYTLGVSKANNKKSNKMDEAGHRDAVLDLSWNRLNRSKLASGSVDHTVALWDLERSSVEMKMRDHHEKVQAVKWRPHTSDHLLSGDFNGRIIAWDTRASSSGRSQWRVKGEIERVTWNENKNNYFAASTNSGSIYYCDVRNPGKSLFKFKAHDGAIPTLSMTSCSHLYSGGSDGVVKVWELSESDVEMVEEKDVEQGMIHCIQSNPDCPHIFAIGGQKGGVKLWNTKSGKQFFPNSDQVPAELADDKKSKLSQNELPPLKSKNKNRFKETSLHGASSKKRQAEKAGDGSWKKNGTKTVKKSQNPELDKVPSASKKVEGRNQQSKKVFQKSFKKSKFSKKV